MLIKKGSSSMFGTDFTDDAVFIIGLWLNLRRSPHGTLAEDLLWEP